MTVLRRHIRSVRQDLAWSVDELQDRGTHGDLQSVLDRDPLHGLIVGDLLVDVPAQLSELDRETAQKELEQRVGGVRPALIVMDIAEIPAVVDRAITTAQGH